VGYAEVSRQQERRRVVDILPKFSAILWKCFVCTNGDAPLAHERAVKSLIPESGHERTSESKSILPRRGCHLAHGKRYDLDMTLVPGDTRLDFKDLQSASVGEGKNLKLIGKIRRIARVTASLVSGWP
jgi:hypothetical protein